MTNINAEIVGGKAYFKVDDLIRWLIYIIDKNRHITDVKILEEMIIWLGKENDKIEEQIKQQSFIYTEQKNKELEEFYKKYKEEGK